MGSSDGTWTSAVVSTDTSTGLGEAGGPTLGVLIRRAYRMVSDQPAQPDPRSTPQLVLERNHREVDDGLITLEHESDLLGLLRTTTDVILEGTCYAHGYGSQGGPVKAGVGVGHVGKFVDVWGDRVLELGAGADLVFGHPAPFDTMALTWERAYGGTDHYATKVLGLRELVAAFWPFGDDQPHEGDMSGSFAYPRNAYGRGFYLDYERERLRGVLLPNLVAPDDPVHPTNLLSGGIHDWATKPAAAYLGTHDVWSFPRCAWAGVSPKLEAAQRAAVREVKLGWVDESLLTPGVHRTDPRRFSAAAPELAGASLLGGEEYRLRNLHPREAEFRGWLPRDRPSVFLEPPNTKTYELAAMLSGVFFEPDEERVTMLWSAQMPVAAEFPPEMCQEMRHAVQWTT